MAAVVDVRSRAFFADLTAALAQLADDGSDPRILFLEASDDVAGPPVRGGPPAAPAAGRRPARRRHRPRARAAARPARRGRPRARHHRPQRPRARRQGARRRSSRTSPGCARRSMSFGYKYGLPVDADLVVDCRFLPNPHWVPELRPLTGRDEPVRDYVLAQHGRGRSSSTTYERLLDIIGDGLPARGQALRHDRRRLHRRQAPLGRDGRGARAPAGGRTASTPRSCTATWGASEQSRPDAFSDAPARRRARRRARPGRVAAGAAPGHRPADRGRHGRRRRRLERPAAPRARRAAARRPADGAGRAVRRRRVGPHLERGRAAPVPQRGRAARPRASATC